MRAKPGVFSVAHLKTGVLCFIFHNRVPGLVKEQTQQRGNEKEIQNFFYCDLEQEQTVICNFIGNVLQTSLVKHQSVKKQGA